MNVDMDIRRTTRRGVLASAALVAVGFASCTGGEEPGAVSRADGPARVNVSRSVTLPAGRSYAATVAAGREAHIATRTSGRIRRIPVDVGSRVAGGDTLAVLDDADVRARIAGARAGARMAVRTFERVEALHAEGAASDHELDGARTDMESARAELRAARAQADYTRLLAPFDGEVTARSADPGELAAPGMPILTLMGGERDKVRTDLPSALSRTVREGDPAEVVVPVDGRRIPVRISRVSSAHSAASRRFRVEAELPPDAGLDPGTVVRLSLEGRHGDTRWIPADAVVRRGQLTGVYTVVEDRLRLHWVRLGLERGGAVELLAGPAGPVVREPSADLHDGRPVAGVSETPWDGPSTRLGELDR